MSNLYRYTGREAYRRAPRQENDVNLSLNRVGMQQVQPHDTVTYLREERGRVIYRHLRSGYIFRTVLGRFDALFEKVT